MGRGTVRSTVEGPWAPPAPPPPSAPPPLHRLRRAPSPCAPRTGRTAVIDAAHTATVLVQALPYIQRFAGRSVVVKLGGAAIDAEIDRALAQDVLLLRSVGMRVVLVHGGGPQVDVMMRRLDMKPVFKDGLRVTDADTLDVVRMVLVGKVNRDLVGTINREAGEEP